MRSPLPRRDFLRTGMLVGGSLALPSLIRSRAAAANGLTAQDLLQCASTTYAGLKDAFDASGNYWQLGNAFDTMTDYLLLAGQQSDLDASADPELAKLAYDKYVDTEPNASCWYDDYCWWGIASAKAWDDRYTAIFEGEADAPNSPDSYVDRFRAAALRTWNLVHTGKDDGVHLGAPNAWDNRNNVSKFDPPRTPDPGYFDFATPRFAGGTWQYDLFADERTIVMGECPINVEDWKGPPECSCLTQPSDPSIPSPIDPSLPQVFLGPYQLTVINGLYLVLALRLAAAKEDGIAGAALQAAEAQFSFFKAWFGRDPQQPLNNAPSLLLTQRDRTALVRERVAWYANDHQVEYWDPETCWGGDQGLVLGGLVDYLAFHPDDRTSKAVARQIASGVKNWMKPNETYVIDPWYPLVPSEPWPGCAADQNKLECSDPGDYKCGSGVFMRYLLHAYQQPDSPIRNLVTRQDYQDYLGQAAALACTMQPADLFDHLNVLATLTTALQLLAPPMGLRTG